MSWIRYSWVDLGKVEFGLISLSWVRVDFSEVGIVDKLSSV